MKILVSPVSYNHDETAVVFHCYSKDRKNTMIVYGIFETETFEIKKFKIVDLRILEKIIDKIINFGFKNENFNKNNPDYRSNIRSFLRK